MNEEKNHLRELIEAKEKATATALKLQTRLYKHEMRSQRKTLEETAKKADRLWWALGMLSIAVGWYLAWKSGK